MRDEARAARLAAAADRRGSAYRFLLEHHDLLADALTRPSWARFAERMAEEGLADAEGKPATAESLRKMWFRVRREVAARRARQATRVAKRETAPVGVTEPERPAEREPQRPGSSIDEAFRRAGLAGAGDGGRVPEVMKWGEDR